MYLGSKSELRHGLLTWSGLESFSGLRFSSISNHIGETKALQLLDEKREDVFTQSEEIHRLRSLLRSL